jgi:hypothetical protein
MPGLGAVTRCGDMCAGQGRGRAGPWPWPVGLVGAAIQVHGPYPPEARRPGHGPQGRPGTSAARDQDQDQDQPRGMPLVTGARAEYGMGRMASCPMSFPISRPPGC